MCNWLQLITSIQLIYYVTLHSINSRTLISTTTTTAATTTAKNIYCIIKPPAQTI